MRAVILKVNLERPGKKGRVLSGSRIRVTDAEYARMVPRIAHDADAYLLDQAEKSAERDKEHPEQRAAFERATAARRANAEQVKEGRERAAKQAQADRGKLEAARLKVFDARKARKAQAEKRRAALQAQGKANAAAAAKEAEAKAK